MAPKFRSPHSRAQVLGLVAAELGPRGIWSSSAREWPRRQRAGNFWRQPSSQLAFVHCVRKSARRARWHFRAAQLPIAAPVRQLGSALCRWAGGRSAALAMADEHRSVTGAGGSHGDTWPSGELKFASPRRRSSLRACAGVVAARSWRAGGRLRGSALVPIRSASASRSSRRA